MLLASNIFSDFTPHSRTHFHSVANHIKKTLQNHTIGMYQSIGTGPISVSNGTCTVFFLHELDGVLCGV